MAELPLEFDLTPTTVPVRIAGQDYLLKEASGAVATTWRNSVFRSTKVDSNGRPSSYEGIAEAEPLLVSLCLYEANGKLVPIQTVKSWPARIQKALFEKAKEISGLDEEETPEKLKENIRKAQEKLDRLEGKTDDPKE